MFQVVNRIEEFRENLTTETTVPATASNQLAKLAHVPLIRLYLWRTKGRSGAEPLRKWGRNQRGGKKPTAANTREDWLLNCDKLVVPRTAACF